MKKIFLIALVIWAFNADAQNNGSITVGGDFDKFYPTLWKDDGWLNNAASHLEIGRSNVHENSDWRGTLVAKFDFRTFQWGNGGHFIKAEIVQHHNVIAATNSNLDFIAGWVDATSANSNASIIIWLRGGGTTYHYKSLYPAMPVVFDGIANPLPYQEVNGPSHTYKTSKDTYVNSNGSSNEGTAYYAGNAASYFAGDLGIGTLDTKGYKLAVAGNMIAESVKVKLQVAWPDYVFSDSYKNPSLQETEKHIKEKGHLPGILSAAEVKANGIDLGEMNAKLLQKIEELTLHLIEQCKANNDQTKLIQELQGTSKNQQQEINLLKSKL